MRIFSDFNEFKAAVGTEIGTSEWVEITQDRINRFAEATCDEQWIHIDQGPGRYDRWKCVVVRPVGIKDEAYLVCYF